MAGYVFVMNADGAESRPLAVCEEAPRIEDHARCGAPAWSADGRMLSYDRSVVIGGKTHFWNIRVVDAESGELLAGRDGFEPRPWGKGFAYLYWARFGFYTIGSYNLSSLYTRLCLARAIDGACAYLPPGHGNVLDYVVAP